MANYATLKAAIQNVVKTNGNNGITGALLQQTLFAMVDSLGNGFMYAGIATPTTNPGTPDQNVFYLAGPGTYQNFGSLTVPNGNLGALKYNGTWAVETVLVGKDYDADLENIQQQINAIIDDLVVSDVVTITKIAKNNLSIRSSGVQAENGSVLYYFPAKANTPYVIAFRNSTGTIRVAYSTDVPAAGVSVTGYTTKAATEGGTTRTPTSDCYSIIASTTFGGDDPIVTVAKTNGIGFDVYQLQQSISDVISLIQELKNETETIGTQEIDFSIVGQIATGDDPRYPAGTIAPVSTARVSDYILTKNISKIALNISIREDGNAMGLAFYDSSKTYISGIKIPGTVVESSQFPANAYYLRVGSTLFSTGPTGRLYSKENIVNLANNFDAFKANVDVGIFEPLEKYWAVCGDSITHANHTGIPDLAADDVYKPIDDYTNWGYTTARSGNHPNYAYYFCKKNRIQWANYGFGGTILGNYIPKYLGENNLLFPFVDARLTQFKAGIAWNYITIMFGWNDNIYGPIYQKDKWLSATYGGDIGYPALDSLIGTTGYATAEQKAACDALGETYFWDAFLGTISDTGTDTYMGAYNYALDYLLKQYPNAKIMIIAPFLGGQDRQPSAKIRAAVHAIANKFSVVCFDFEDLPYWYFRTDWNTTPFPNPNRPDGRWVKQNGETTPATIEGFNRARFCADSVHPTLLGYQWLADPLGSKLLNG